MTISCLQPGGIRDVEPSLSPDSTCHHALQLPGRTSCTDVIIMQFPLCTLFLHCWSTTKDLVQIVLMQDFFYHLSVSPLKCTHGVLFENSRLVKLAGWYVSLHCEATTNRELHLSGLSSNESLVTELQSPVSTAINL